MEEGDLRARIKEITHDASLTEAEKSDARQKLMMGKSLVSKMTSGAATQSQTRDLNSD